MSELLWLATMRGVFGGYLWLVLQPGNLKFDAVLCVM